MSEAWSFAGALLLMAATAPQIVRLSRTKSASDISFTFAALNVAGILLMAARSIEIAEWGFLALNAVTAMFWAYVVAIKVWTRAAASPTATATP